MHGKYLAFSVVALTLGVLAAPASAAPAVGIFGNEARTAGTTLVEKAARRCWWHRGHKHCRYYREYRPGFNFYIGPGYRHRHGHWGHRHWRHRHGHWGHGHRHR
jgi:hypothetical protein